MRLYDDLHYWLVISSKLEDVTDIIDDEAFTLSSEFVIAIPAHFNNYDLYDVYNPSKKRGGKMNITYYSEWNQSNGLTVKLIQSKYKRRADLNGMPWKVYFFGVRIRVF